MADDSSNLQQNKNPDHNGNAPDTSEVSKFLHIEVAHPLTRDRIIEAVDKALKTQPVIPTFHTAPSSSPLPSLNAAASEPQGENEPKNRPTGKGLLMFVQSQGPD